MVFDKKNWFFIGIDMIYYFFLNIDAKFSLIFLLVVNNLFNVTTYLFDLCLLFVMDMVNHNMDTISVIYLKITVQHDFLQKRS